MSSITDLFTEKLRPKNIAQLIAPDRIKLELNKGLIQNLLLYGSPGTGKTSAAYILAEGYTTYYINASTDGRIDLIRDKLKTFCSSYSLEHGKEKLKCVILDEVDGSSDDFFKGLRPLIERFSSTTRFIMTCNYFQNIPDPIKSRFNCISFDPLNSNEESIIYKYYFERIIAILNSLKIEYNQDSLHSFIKNYFPDMRSILNKIQSIHIQGIKVLDINALNNSFDFKDLFDICVINNTTKPWENYKLVTSEYASKVDDALVSLGKEFPEYIRNNFPDKLDKLPHIIIAIAEHQYQKSFVVDPMITLLSCIFKLQMIINS